MPGISVCVSILAFRSVIHRYEHRWAMRQFTWEDTGGAAADLCQRGALW